MTSVQAILYSTCGGATVKNQTYGTKPSSGPRAVKNQYAVHNDINVDGPCPTYGKGGTASDLQGCTDVPDPSSSREIAVEPMAVPLS